MGNSVNCFKFYEACNEFLNLPVVAIGRPSNDLSLPDFNYSYGVVFHVNNKLLRVLTVRYSYGHRRAYVRIDDVRTDYPNVTYPVYEPVLFSGEIAGEWIRGAKNLYRSYRDTLTNVRGSVW